MDGKSNVSRVESCSIPSFLDALSSRSVYVKVPNVDFHEAFGQRDFACP
jgi:hypothetical protein